MAEATATALDAQAGQRKAAVATMSAVCARLLAISFALVAGPGHGQSFHYVEAGLASCPARPKPSHAAPKEVLLGVPVAGRIHVSCGFDKGSYTVSLNSTDADASFSPKTFLVNFGRVVGHGAFAVTFSTIGIHSVSTTITSNMGSPAVLGQFVSAANEFKVSAR